MRQPSNTKGTLANISLRMLLEKREENMLGIERFFSNEEFSYFDKLSAISQGGWVVTDHRACLSL